MSSAFPVLIMAGILLLITIGMLTSAIIAHRGKRFWGTWMMLIGGIGLIIGLIAVTAATYFLFQVSMSGPEMNQLGLYSIISVIGSLASIGSLIAYLVGLLGLAVRYGAVIKRADDLETINASLMSERDQSNS